MPELPEVETTVRDLRPHLIGRTITRARVTWERTVAQPNAKQFARAIVGYKIAAINRRGKYLVFQLERAAPPKKLKSKIENRKSKIENSQSPNPPITKYLVVHLRMTGQFGLHPPHVKRDKHQHVHLLLDDGRELRFHDFRKFGRWWLVDNPEHVVGKLGPEPLEMTKKEFLARLRARRRRLKSLLLDQTFIAGVGNIYADEALWYARLHPLRDAMALTDQEASDLYHAIRRVFRQAIGVGGTSFDATYKRINGESGAFQEKLRVVGRAGETCYRCGAPIVKTVVGQRGTYYCPHCQRLEETGKEGNT
jgi:formamidopyrimidine-DNA glycosylase